MTVHGVVMCNRAISRGEAASAVAAMVPLVSRPSVTSRPRSCSGCLATLRATTVCSPMAGTAPITRTAVREPNSPKVAGGSRRAAITVIR